MPARTPHASLFEEVGRLHVVPFLVVASFVLLGFGLTVPVLEVQKVAVHVSSYSVLEGVRGLATGGHSFLALLVGAFSVAFPLAKLSGVAWLWFRPADPAERHRRLRAVEVLGKWSMLDVFVVCLLLGTVNLGFPAGAEPLFGVYWFEAAILVSMVATRLAVREAWRVVPEDARVEPRERRVSRRLLAWRGGACLAAAAGLVTGLTLPILRTEKWHFWDSEYSVFLGILELFEDDYFVLALSLLAFVFVIPVLDLAWVGSVTVWRAARGGERLPRLPLPLRWAMADVFLCAVLVVAAKLGDAVASTYLVGLWFLVPSVLLATALTVWPLEARDD